MQLVGTMEFPVWYVPFITAPMLIPLIAVPHVIVAQFAVGAGFFSPISCAGLIATLESNCLTIFTT